MFRAVHKVLLPKDYLIWRLSGEFVSEMSDASGTLWLDCARRDWSDRMLAATELTRAQMPRLVEATRPPRSCATRCGANGASRGP